MLAQDRASLHIATAATLIDSWRSGSDRRVIITAAASTASATALTAYLVRSINLRLLQGGKPLSAPERHKLVKTWHQANLVRLVALAIASVALRRTALPASQRGPIGRE